MTKRAKPGERVTQVFDAICDLGEEQTTPPTQAQIAEHLQIHQQQVSQAMLILAASGRIKWLSRYTYCVIDARWEAPTDS